MRMIKKAIAMGNSAAVYVPKEYSGRHVVILLPEGIEDIKRKIVERLAGCMDNIVGAYIFGSYARGESHPLSDIDVLIIAKDEDKRLKHLFDDMDVRVTTLEKIRRSIERFPAITIPLLKEAKTVINPVLLDDLRNSKVNYKNFRWNFDDIRRTLRIIGSFVRIDEEDIDISHIYSLVMRARVCYMMECLLKGRQFSNRGLQEEMKRRGLAEKTYEGYYGIYRQIRDGEEIDGRIDKGEIMRFIAILERYLSELEDDVKRKTSKSSKSARSSKKPEASRHESEKKA